MPAIVRLPSDGHGMTDQRSSAAFSAIAKGASLIAALIMGLPMFSQPYFSKIYENFFFGGASIARDSGLVLVAGNTLCRVDRNGTPLWTTAYTTSTGDGLLINDVAWIGDSSFVFVGRAILPNGTSNAMVHQVVSALGVPVWGGQLNFFNADELRRAERAPDGSAVVCGSTWGLSETAGYAVRIGSEQDTYSTPLRSNPNGGPWVAFILEVRPTSDGGFVSVGIDYERLIAYKVTADGIIAWSRSMPIGGPDLGVVRAVEGDAGSTYIATQAFGDFFRLIKLDQSGTVAWSKTYALPGSDLPMGMVRFPNGDMWINGPDWLMACSPAGDVLWAHTLPHVALTMEATLEGDGVFLIGYAGSDGWLMRTDMNGQVADCTDSTLVPIVAPETLSAAPYGPPDPTISLEGYLSDFAPGQVPTTAVDCIPTVVPDVWTAVADRERIMLSPNPVVDRLWMTMDEQPLEIRIINASGVSERALPFTWRNGTTELDASGLAPGAHTVWVRTKEGVRTARFVKL